MQQFQKGFNYLILRGQYFEGLINIGLTRRLCEGSNII